MSQNPLPASDLVLRLNGGNRDGERISISTPKCSLGFEERDQQVEIQAAIFRGQAGAAVYSFGREVLINGNPKTIHWLQSGDRIDFADSISAIVEELGYLTGTDTRVEQEMRLAQQNAFLQTAIQSLTTGDHQPEEEPQPAPGHSWQQANVELEASDLPELSEMVALQGNPTDSSSALPEGEPETSVTPAFPDEHDSSQAHETNETHFATESVGKQFDSLTHSPLADGSSQPTPPTADSEPTGLDQLSSIGEQIRAELAAERAQSGGEPPAEEQRHADQASVAQEATEPSDVEQNIADIIARVSQADPATETAERESLGSPEKPSAPADPESSESVTELLERMKSEGQWNGLPEGDEDVKSQDEPVTAATEPEPIAELASGSQEASVEDYMAQLLNRMRGGSASLLPKQTVKPKPKIQQSAQPKQQSEPEPFVPPENPLKPEEFVPQKRAEPLKSLGAMRELANTTARTAIKHSELNRRKALGTAQIAIGVSSFVLSLYYLVFGSQSIGDFQFFVGIVCVLIAGFLAWRFYSTMLHNEKVDAEERRLSAAKEALDAGVPAEQVVAEYEQQRAESDV